MFCFCFMAKLSMFFQIHENAQRDRSWNCKHSWCAFSGNNFMWILSNGKGWNSFIQWNKSSTVWYKVSLFWITYLTISWVHYPKEIFRRKYTGCPIIPYGFFLKMWKSDLKFNSSILNPYCHGRHVKITCFFSNIF